MMDKLTKMFVFYMIITFGVWWSIAWAYFLFNSIFTSYLGVLTLFSPLMLVVLYLPSMTALIVYYRLKKWDGIKGILYKFVPEKKDLFWFPVLLVLFVIFSLAMRFGCLALGVPVPQISYTPGQILLIVAGNFIKETGLLGGVIGWMGFVLPFFQSKLKDPIHAAILTGLLFGLWVLPGYFIASFHTQTSYSLYVIQLISFILFQSYIFNVTKGNLLIYFFSFGLISSGSHINLYYFNNPIQVLQIIFFALAALTINIIFRKLKINYSVQRFPEFIMISLE